MCDIAYDDESGHNLQDKWTHAHRSHVCYACGETIRKGDLYHYTANAHDGEIDVYKHCERCWLMLLAIARNNGEGCRYDLNCGEIWEMPPPDVEALAFRLPGDPP